MYLEIDLPVFWLTEEQETQIEAGVNVPVEECEIRYMTFYTIENIKDYSDICIISSGSEDFTINMTRENLKRRIREAKIPNFS